MKEGTMRIAREKKKGNESEKRESVSERIGIRKSVKKKSGRAIGLGAMEFVIGFMVVMIAAQEEPLVSTSEKIDLVITR